MLTSAVAVLPLANYLYPFLMTRLISSLFIFYNSLLLGLPTTFDNVNSIEQQPQTNSRSSIFVRFEFLFAVHMMGVAVENAELLLLLLLPADNDEFVNLLQMQ